MHTPWKNLTAAPRKTGNVIYILIGINVAVFLGTIISPPLGALLRLPAAFSVLLTHFWAPLTYMFVHDGFLSVIFNMLWLYWMGQVFDEFLGNNRIVGVYLLGGLVGGLLFCAAYNLLPGFANNSLLALYSIAGATASVLAIVVATATLLPERTI